MKYFLSLLFAFTFAGLAQAQPGAMRMAPPSNAHHEVYKDSAQFKAAFKELYPLIKPTPNVRERTQMMFERMSRMFKARDIDSAAAYDSVMKALDPNMDEKLLFDAYRAQFSAEELKALTAFFKTPAGKHYLEVGSRLQMASGSELDQYISRTIAMAIRPMMKLPEHPAMPGRRPGVMQRPDSTAHTHE